MSQLSPFVRSFRAISEAADVEVANLPSSAPAATIFRGLARMYRGAATDLEQQIARDLTRTGRQS